MKRRRRDPFGTLRAQAGAPREYDGFESRASLLNIGQRGAWLRLRTLADEVKAEAERSAAIQADPFRDVPRPKFRAVPDSACRAPLVTWPNRKDGRR